MTLSYSLILAFVGIAETTSAFVPFENFNSVRSEVIEYCDDPAKYSQKKSVHGRIKHWDVSALTNMNGLFSPSKGSFKRCPNCSTCNPPVSNWNVSGVEDFGYMFKGAAAFNRDLSGWDVRKGQSFYSMFYGARVFNQDLSGWNVGKGLWFGSMFQDSGMNHYIGEWNIRFGDRSQNQLSVISSMLQPGYVSASWYRDSSFVEKQQFINLITPKKISKDVN